MSVIVDILMCKCKSRQEQVILVVGMVVLVVVCVGVCKFALGMGNAGVQTEAHSRTEARQAGGMIYYGYLIFGISGLLGLAFAFMGALNIFRLATGTGLSDPDDGWS